MYSGSSRSNNRPNADGTVNLYCCTCGEFVSRATVRIRVQCDLCRRVEAGETLTPEAIEFYQQSKMAPDDNVRLLVLPQVPGQTEKKFRLGAMTGQFFEAIGIKRKKKKKTGSQEAAKEIKKGRLFDGISLGNMTQVDSDLKKDKK